MTTIKLRRGTAAQWASAATVLAAGEPGVETDTGVYKVGDGSTAWASLNPVLKTTYATVIALTGTGIDTTGATDSITALNALLATASGKRARGIPGASYLISAPLVLPAGGNVELDMTGCTVTLKASSNCNILQNYAVAHPQRTLTTASITSGSATLTITNADAGYPFTSADTGRTIVVTQGAAANVTAGGTNPLCATMTYVSATQVTLSTTAGQTVSSGAASIYDRDSGISIVGGTWARGSNAGTGTAAHNLMFRRVDTLTVRDVKVTSSAGKFAIALGDVTDVNLTRIKLAAWSDGIHIAGPASSVFASHISGSTGDDIFALTAREWAAYEDVCGDITNVRVQGIFPVGSMCGFKLIGGAGVKLRRITVDGIYGTTTQAAVRVIDDTAGATDVDALRIRDVHVTQGSSYHAIELATGTGGHVSIDGVHYTGATNKAAVDCYTNGASTFSMSTLEIRNVDIDAASTGAWVLNHEYGSITNVVIDGVTIPTLSPANIGGTVRFAGVSVGEARVSNVQAAGTGGFFLVGMSNSCTLTRLALANVKLTGGSNGAVVATGSGVTHIDASNLYVTGLARVVLAQSATDIRIAASTIDVTSQIVRSTAASGAIRLETQAVNNVAGVAAITHDSTAPLSLTGFGKADITILTPTDGDTVTNTNAAPTCGTGPVIYNTAATKWKHLYTAATS